VASDEIAVNQWAADQMDLKAGDRLRLTYYKRQLNGDLTEVSSDDASLAFKVSRILPMKGLGADPIDAPGVPMPIDPDRQPGRQWDQHLALSSEEFARP